MSTRTATFAVGTLGVLLLVAVLAAPSVTQEPAPGGGTAEAGLTNQSTIHIHHHYQLPYYTPYSYGFNPYHPQYNAATQYSRDQLESFYRNRGDMAQVRNMQAQDAGIGQLDPDTLQNLNNLSPPERVTKDEFDPATGEIQWPEALQGKAYAQYREKLETLFKERAATHAGYGSTNFHQIQAVASAMYSELKAHRWTVMPKPYIYAESFLRSLAYESGFGSQSATTPAGQ